MYEDDFQYVNNSNGLSSLTPSFSFYVRGHMGEMHSDMDTPFIIWTWATGGYCKTAVTEGHKTTTHEIVIAAPRSTLISTTNIHIPRIPDR